MKRNIITKFFDHKNQVLKTNMAANPNSAVMRAHLSLIMNTHAAWSAQVYDAETAILYASIRRKANGVVETLVEYDTAKHRNPIYSAQALFHGIK